LGESDKQWVEASRRCGCGWSGQQLPVGDKIVGGWNGCIVLLDIAHEQSDFLMPANLKLCPFSLVKNHVRFVHLLTG
jgi:hypothetical protein